MIERITREGVSLVNLGGFNNEITTWFVLKMEESLHYIDKTKCTAILIGATPYKPDAATIKYVYDGIVYIDFYSALRSGFGMLNYAELVAWINKNEYTGNQDLTLGGTYDDKISEAIEVLKNKYYLYVERDDSEYDYKEGFDTYTEANSYRLGCQLSWMNHADYVFLVEETPSRDVSGEIEWCRNTYNLTKKKVEEIKKLLLNAGIDY